MQLGLQKGSETWRRKNSPVFLSSSLSRTNIYFTVLKWNQFTASLKGSSTKTQLLKLKAEIPWAERQMSINCGVWDSWLISFSHSFICCLSYLFHAALDRHYSDLLVGLCSITACKKIQQIPLRLPGEFSLGILSEISFSGYFHAIAKGGRNSR